MRCLMYLGLPRIMRLVSSTTMNKYTQRICHVFCKWHPRIFFVWMPVIGHAALFMKTWHITCHVFFKRRHSSHFPMVPNNSEAGVRNACNVPCDWYKFHGPVICMGMHTCTCSSPGDYCYVSWHVMWLRSFYCPSLRDRVIYCRVVTFFCPFKFSFPMWCIYLSHVLFLHSCALPCDPGMCCTVCIPVTWFLAS
jgi:hypothetical protein